MWNDEVTVRQSNYLAHPESPRFSLVETSAFGRPPVARVSESSRVSQQALLRVCGFDASPDENVRRRVSN